MKILNDELEAAILTHISIDPTRERCGVIVVKDDVKSFIPVDNVHAMPSSFFRMDARHLRKIEKAGNNIIAYVHNHPYGSNEPSIEDIESMNTHKKPFIIVGMDGDMKEHRPQVIPLLGRPYRHGTLDCFGIVRDYYARELGIFLKDIERVDRWWETDDYGSMYVDNFKAFGFREVPKDQLQRHDLLICYWGDTHHPNHALIYLGNDGSLVSEETPACVGDRLCLHHPYGGHSSRFPLGEKRLAACAMVVRHESMFK